MKEKVNQMFKDKLFLVMLVLGLLTIVAAAGVITVQRGKGKMGTALLPARRHPRRRQLHPKAVQPRQQRQMREYLLTQRLRPRQGRMPLTPRRSGPMSRPTKARTRRWKADGLRMRQRMEPNDCK